MRGCFMKKNVTKLATSMLAACFLTVGAIPALAGTWQKSGNNWTYLNDAGQMVAGQMVNDNNHLYYLGTDGIMKTGLVPINGAYYYFNPSGNMVTGWVLDNGSWYYMQGTADHFGQMAVNTTQIVNGKTYYFGADGKMVANTTIGGTQYGADGAAVGQETQYKPAYNQYTNGDDVYDNVGDTIYASFGENSPTYIKSNDGSWIDTANIQPLNVNTCTQEILQLVNRERAKYGIAPLTLENSLCEIANKRANEIIEEYNEIGSCSHDGFQKYKPTILNTYQICGENIAYGGGLNSAAAAMQSWLNSSGHRQNILNSNFTSIGIGVAQQGLTYYFVQDFAG